MSPPVSRRKRRPLTLPHRVLAQREPGVARAAFDADEQSVNRTFTVAPHTALLFTPHRRGPYCSNERRDQRMCRCFGTRHLRHEERPDKEGVVGKLDDANLTVVVDSRDHKSRALECWKVVVVEPEVAVITPGRGRAAIRIGCPRARKDSHGHRPARQ
jgi:hypothetical protein